MVVHDHLRLAARAACEVEQEVVSDFVLAFLAVELRCKYRSLPEVFPVLRHCRTYRDAVSQTRTVGSCAYDIAQHCDIAHGYYHPYVCLMAAVYYVLVGEKVCRRHDDSPDLVQGNHGNPPFDAPFEYQHHAVAAAYSELQEITCRLVCVCLVLLVVHVFHIAAVIGPHHRLLVGVLRGVHINDIVAEVEVFRHGDTVVLHEVLVGFEIRFGEESVYHCHIVVFLFVSFISVRLSDLLSRQS